jgi:hypothetical protein
LFAVFLDIVVDTGFKDVLKNSPVGELELKTKSIVSATFSETPPAFCDCIVIMPESVPEEIDCGSVVKTNWETSARATFEIIILANINKMIFFMVSKC